MSFRFHFSAVLVLMLAPSRALAFHASLPRRNRRRGAFLTTTSRRGVTQLQALTDEEIFARARQQKAALLEESEEVPRLYSDELYDDMDAVYLVLEKRVQEGPGCLTATELEAFRGQLERIMEEMKRNEHLKEEMRARRKGEARSAAAEASKAAVQEAPRAAAPKAPATKPSASPFKARSAAPSAAPSQRRGGIDTSNDEEGPAYDGTGGMGQPRGTVNTYVIEGMDEMTAEEYQVALERTVIERARARRYGGGATGNRSSWDYLNALSGEKGILKEDKKTNKKN